MAVSGNTDEPFDEPTAQKTAALRVAVRRAPAVSQGSTDGHRIALRLAPGGSPRRTATPAASRGESQALHPVLTGALSRTDSIATNPTSNAPHMYQAGASGEAVICVSHAAMKEVEPPNMVIATA